jgi:hypothetical protein
MGILHMYVQFELNNTCINHRLLTRQSINTHVWRFMTKYLRFLCKFTSWSCGCIEKQIRCWKNCWFSYNIDKCNKKFMFVFKKYDRQNHLWSFMTKYLRFLCKFTSWSGETPTGIDLSLDSDFLTDNFSDVFLSWTRIMSVLIGWPI